MDCSQARRVMICCSEDIVQMRANHTRTKPLQPFLMRIKPNPVQGFCMSSIIEKADAIWSAQTEQHCECIWVGAFHLTTTIFDAQAHPKRFRVRKHFAAALHP